eukprot:4466650-Amphidinium_carterae.1
MWSNRRDFPSIEVDKAPTLSRRHQCTSIREENRPSCSTSSSGLCMPCVEGTGLLICLAHTPLDAT